MKRNFFQLLIDRRNEREEECNRQKVQDLKEQIEQNEGIQKFSEKLKKKGNKPKAKRKKHWSGYTKNKAKWTVISYMFATIFMSINMYDGEIRVGRSSTRVITGWEAYAISSVFILFFLGHTIWLIRNFKYFK